MLEDKINQRTYIVAPRDRAGGDGRLGAQIVGGLRYSPKYGRSYGRFELPDETARLDTYNESALSIVEQYPAQWIRVLSNQIDKCFTTSWKHRQ